MQRPDLIHEAGDRLNRLERVQIAFVRKTFEPGAVDRGVRWCQRSIGCKWIHHSTKHLRHMHGLERLPTFEADRSYILVSNHRSFFDLYVVFGDLVLRGLQHRIVFPVRAKFFYDHPLGLFVNGVMSFFAMYPPIFRERKQIPLNAVSLEELSWLLRQGGAFAGVHPEGTRKLDDDPYTLLPAQRGVGRLIHSSRATVIPVFVNGLINDLPRQIRSNFDGTGQTVHIVFGSPVDFGDLLDRPASLKLDRTIAEHAMNVVAQLGQEEKRIRHGAQADEQLAAE